MEEEKIRQIINEAVDDKKNIVVEVYRGCFSHMHNVPEGFTYQVVDWDNLKETDESEYESVTKKEA